MVQLKKKKNKLMKKKFFRFMESLMGELIYQQLILLNI